MLSRSFLVRSGAFSYNLFMASTANHGIVADPDHCGGWPRVANTRIRVWDIYVWTQIDGRSPAEIVADYPQLKLADVHAALSYYYDHVDAIRQQVKEADELVEAMKTRHGPGLLDKLQSPDAADSLPSR